MPKKPKTSRRRSSGEVLETIGNDSLAPISEAEYDNSIKAYYMLHQQNYKDSYPALLVLLDIARKQLQSKDKSEPQPSTDVPIPWWVVEAIAFGVQEYERAPVGKTIGECLGIEGGGQGRNRTRDMLLMKQAGILYAAAVLSESEAARHSRNTQPITTAIMEVAERYKVSQATVKTAWQANRNEMLDRKDPVITAYRKIQTSGSG